MTEYDYSPEALERFLSTQDRIARWVVQTEEHRPQFDSVYLMSPPTSPPITGYPYSYGSATNSAPVFSAGSYAYPTAPGVSSAGTPSYLSSPPGYFPPNASYPAAVQAHAQVYSQRPSLNHSPQSAPLPTYHPYGQPQSQPMATAPAQYPQSAAYPPAIYPLAAYGPQQQQQLPPKPVFYQRIFSGSRSGTKKGSKRRSS
ncbi:hypothetical protein H0H87_005825 [Tephrocybe sp. NHM501043]|nr:hypothetical protein H0H87_005825 [Tephrocybe sp. NHM501043]